MPEPFIEEVPGAETAWRDRIWRLNTKKDVPKVFLEVKDGGKA